MHVHTKGAPYIGLSTAVRQALDLFVLISAAHWCKEEFIKKKKEKKGSIGQESAECCIPCCYYCQIDKRMAAGIKSH